MTPRNHNPFKRLSERQKILLLSLVTGLCSGLAAVFLLKLIELIRTFINEGFVESAYYWQYLVLPGVGMLISLLLLRFVVKDNISHGVTKVLLAMSRGESKIKAHNMWSSLLTSSVTIGFGGSVGAEAPIVYTGAAIGSNIGRVAGLSYKNITLLLGCGAAGAVAGIFKAPLAGLLFTIEILLFNVSMDSLLAILVSTISASGVAYFAMGGSPVFKCDLTPFSFGNVPFYLILGAICGFCSLYFTNGTLWLEEKIGKIGNRYCKWAISAAGLGLLIFLFPELYGEGYDSVRCLLQSGEDIGSGRTVLSALTDSAWGIPVFFFLVFLFKIVAMALTNAGGGVGGTFGPTLFEGAILGFVVVRVFELVGVQVPEQNFVLVGMAALMAGVMQAPMTAIFLIAEISGGYDLLIPLIITSTLSFGTARLFDRYSIYSKRVAQSGDLLTHDNDRAVLTLMKTADLVRDKYPRININASLRETVKVISGDNAAILAVLDDKGRFQGIVDVGNVRKYLFDVKNYDKLFVFNIMESSPAVIRLDEKVDSVMAKFDKTGAWRLPVLDAAGNYVGCISRSRILMAYRDELREITTVD